MAQSPDCSTLDRRRLISCALTTSPLLREELAAREAGEGRREAARPVLPSNPLLYGSVASRSGPVGQVQVINWYLTLSQELEIAGQRGRRLDAADLELRALSHRVDAARASVAAEVWTAYFRTLAAKERTRLAARLETATSQVATTVRAMAQSGLASEVDADVADTAALRAARQRLDAEAAALGFAARVRALAGAPAAAEVTGALEPLPVEGGGQVRPELLALEQIRAFVEARKSVVERERVPNPTVHLYAQNDGFDEAVFGAGLTLPVPLPQPVGRTRRGEVLELNALERRAAAEAERATRELGLELLAAQAELAAARQARALYSTERAQRALSRLDAIAVQVRAGRLTMRDGLVSQEALVEQLQSEIDVREALCLASVRYRRAAGLPPEGATP